MQKYFGLVLLEMLVREIAANVSTSWKEASHADVRMPILGGKRNKDKFEESSLPLRTEPALRRTGEQKTK